MVNFIKFNEMDKDHKYTIELKNDMAHVGIDYEISQYLTPGIYQMMARQITDKTNDIFLEGLKNKGFEFDKRWEIEPFIRSRCKCIEYEPSQQKVYFVDNIPFLLIDYSVETNIKWEHTERETKVIADSYRYRFL